MNKRLYHYTTLTLHLSLEDWYNDGLTPEEAKEVIEKLDDPSSSFIGAGSKLCCTRGGINNNWNVSVRCSSEEAEYMVLDDIEFSLNAALERKKKTGSIHPKLWED